MSDDWVYEHDHYCEPIRAWLSADPKRSQSALAKRANVSRSMVAMVLSGKRELPLPQARTWGRALGLEEEESLTFFEALVRAEVGETIALRRAARQHVAAARQYRSAPRITGEEGSLLAAWFVPVLLELARIGGLPDDPAEAAGLLWPEVDAIIVGEAVRALREQGVLVPEAGGRLRTGGQPLATAREVGEELAELVRSYHASQFEHAGVAMRSFGRDVRHVSSLVVAVPSGAVDELIGSLHRFQLDVIEPFRAEPDDLGPVRLVQVSVQLFPRTAEVARGRSKA
jgi:uncharacterized protein (TIGR02147 family)